RRPAHERRYRGPVRDRRLSPRAQGHRYRRLFRRLHPDSHRARMGTSNPAGGRIAHDRRLLSRACGRVPRRRRRTLMPIPLWDYRKEYEEEREDLLAGVDKVLRSGQLILGSSVRAFEEAFARHCGTAHGVGVNSGTDALFLALRALGIGPRDEVITVSNTAIPTIAAIVSTGAIPRFVDIDPRTYLMDIAELEGAL